MSVEEKLKSDPSSARHAVERLIKAQSIALVGASDRSAWSQYAFRNLERIGFSGRVHLVNRSGGSAHGRPCATSCAEIGEPIDGALLLVSRDALPDTLADLGRAEIGAAVILAAGFAEVGPSGAVRQSDLAARAGVANVHLLGPNCLGLVNYVDRVALWAAPMHRGGSDPVLGIVSQSGAVAAQIAGLASTQRIGVTHIISTGNEVDIDVPDAIDFLVDQPHTKSIAIFIEGVRRPERFRLAALKALAAGKPIVALKVGTSEAAYKAAQTHTGTLTGDDRIFSAVCESLGIVRVHSLEDLVVTSHMLTEVGNLKAGGVGLVAMSGGICEIALDQAEREGILLPELPAHTQERLRNALPDFSSPNNPLDVTGGAMLRPELLEQALAALSEVSDISVVLCAFEAAGLGRDFLSQIAKGFAACGKPCILVNPSICPVTSDMKAMHDELGLKFSGSGLVFGLSAIGRILERQKRVEFYSNGRSPLATIVEQSYPRPRSEREILAHLSAFGVPIVPGQIARTRAEAIAFAAEFADTPLALKVASAEIAHKSDVGGVRLNVSGADAVGQAFDAIISNVSSIRPTAGVQGVIVSPMRRGGVELIVGVVRDPQWGLALTIGLGGVFIELLRDTAVRLFPIEKHEVPPMLASLRGSRLLTGFRGSTPVNVNAIADAVVALCTAAAALGPDMTGLEINPLLATAEGVEALDALVTFQPG